MYKEQPLFADIDVFLRAQGFQLFRLAGTGRTFKPLIRDNSFNSLSQLLWPDAVYVRDFMAFDQLAPTALLKLAIIPARELQRMRPGGGGLGNPRPPERIASAPAYLQRLFNPV
jgi:hypothetical protein